MDSRKHWEKIYTTKAESEVSWFQPYPKTSVEFLELFNLPLTANIIDIGGGDSHLVDVLLEKGYQNIWVLDISAHAIERSKKRLGERASQVHWVVSDVTAFDPPVQFDFWHDRAAFHFLTSEENIMKYVQITTRGIRPGGYLVLGTFSEEGPQKCSGLEVKQYSETSMAVRFQVSFDRIRCVYEDHLTPSETVQNFLFCSFKRK